MSEYRRKERRMGIEEKEGKICWKKHLYILQARLCMLINSTVDEVIIIIIIIMTI